MSRCGDATGDSPHGSYRWIVSDRCPPLPRADDASGLHPRFAIALVAPLVAPDDRVALMGRRSDKSQSSESVQDVQGVRKRVKV